MFKLTFLLIVVIGLTMLIGGRDLTPTERATVQGHGLPQATHGELPASELAPPALKPATSALATASEVSPSTSKTSGATPVSEAAVRSAVQLALSEDTAATEPAAANAPTPVPAQPTNARPVPAQPSTASSGVTDAIASALADSQVWYVNASRVNVRSGPSTSYNVLDQLYFGEATEVLSDPNQAWVKIRIQGDGVEGYISSQFLQNDQPHG